MPTEWSPGSPPTRCPPAARSPAHPRPCPSAPPLGPAVSDITAIAIAHSALSACNPTQVTQLLVDETREIIFRDKARSLLVALGVDVPPQLQCDKPMVESVRVCLEDGTVVMEWQHGVGTTIVDAQRVNRWGDGPPSLLPAEVLSVSE